MSELVCLVNPPFGAIERPNIGLGLLQASAQNAGIACSTLYANLAFAERIGRNLYYWFSSTGEYVDLFGEWVFAGSLFPGGHAAAHEYIQRFVAGGYTEVTFRMLLPRRSLEDTLLATRDLATEFIDQLAHDIAAARPRVVGCTSSFQQNCASLALLKRVHELDGSIVTLLGGPNCEGPLARGMRRAFPWLDFTVSGEAELFFPELLRLLLQHGRKVDEDLLPECVVGASRAADGVASEAARAVVSDLDSSPVPDYSDYFDQLAQSRLSSAITPGLLLETSRGCWWGQKHRCTFCGLNGLGLKHRAKSPDRIVGEVEELCARYNTPQVEFVDNNLDLRLVDSVFPHLAKRSQPVSLFFESRVMGKRQIELMAQGGVRWLQVGIESLHPRLLRLMRKGSSVCQNIQVLRWAYERGIRVSYNLMYGFPGEQDGWYLEMSDLLPLLTHLEPPRNLVRLRYDRFSAYHEEPQRFGLRLAPRQAYAYVYALPAELIADIAYFYEDTGELQQDTLEQPGLQAVRKQWLQWRRAFWTSQPGRERAALHLLPCGGGPQRILYDTRCCATETAAVLTALESHVLEYCDRARRLDQIETDCAREEIDHDSTVAQAVEALLARKALLHSDGSYLSLAATPPQRVLTETRDFPGGYYTPEE